MNTEQYLLIQLMEECAELQHACAKALRFGLTDGYPNTTRTNKSDIEQELVDLLTIIQLLFMGGVLEDIVSEERIADKINKVKTYMQYSKSVGILE